MLTRVKRFFAGFTRLPNQNSTRNQPSNLYLEYIRSFKTLPLKEQEYVFYRLYALFSSAFTAFNFEEFKEYFLGLKSFESKVYIMKERTFDLDVAIVFLGLDRYYYKENDYSIQNEYLSSQNLYCIQPHFRGANIGKVLMDVAEVGIKNEFPGRNRISFNTTLNSYYYEYRGEVTPLVYPGPKKMPNGEIDKLARKMMKDYDVAAITDDKPFVIDLPATINGADVKRYINEYEKASPYRKYFIDQTGLQGNRLLVNLVIYNLIEGNTLGLEAGEYGKFPKIIHEIRDYQPKYT